MTATGAPASLTVAVATCGRPDSLMTCLVSLEAQTVLPDQIIVVDQDPKPETRLLVESCGMSVEYHEQERIGLSASRNLALAHATGDFFAVTDDDCHADTRWCEQLLRTFSSAGKPQVVTGPILPPNGSPPPGAHIFSLRKSRETVLYDRRTLPWIVGSGANFAARTELVRKMGGWNDKLGVGTGGKAAEDCEIIDRLLVANHPIVYCGDAIIHHAWQTHERRKETRRTYSFGMGALIGTVLSRGDIYAIRMLGAYGKQHIMGCIRAILQRDHRALGERFAALRALPSGIIYGLRHGRGGLDNLDRSQSINSTSV